MVGKEDFVVRHGAKIIAVRKTWAKAQESVDKYVRDLSMDGTKYTRTKTQTNESIGYKGTRTKIYGEFCFTGDRQGALLVLTINRGS